MELFKNSNDALIFAHRFAGQSYPESAMSKRMKAGGGRIGSDKGLQGLDGAAQAGLILSALTAMDDLQRKCLVARYSERVDACPCCGSDRAAKGYREAILALATWSAQFLKRPEAASERLLYAIAQSYFDRSVKLSSTAEKLGIPKQTASDHKSRIWPHLSKLDKLALARADELLTGFYGEVDD